MATHIQIGDQTPRVQLTIGDTSDPSVLTSMDGPWSYTFPIFEEDNLEVYYDGVKKDLTTDYTVSGAGSSEGGTVSPVSGKEPPQDTVVTIARRLVIQRTSDFQESGEFRAKVINDELDYLTAALQQVSDDQARSGQMAITETAEVDTLFPSPEADAVLAWNGSANGFVNGPSVSEISNAQSYATAAGSSAAAAATSEINAAASASAAQNWATAAPTAAASNMYASNESKAADFSISATDDGKQFLIDTTAGAVTVTLPLGDSATDGFRVALAKVSADNNAVIVTRSGTDTINGATTWQFSIPYGQSVVSLDTTSAPDIWFAAGVGVTYPVGVSELNDNAKPYDVAFIAGFDGTMSAEPVVVQRYGELVMTRSGAFIGEAGYIDTASTGAPVIVDIEKNGVSIYTTAPQFAATSNSLTAGTLKTDGTASFTSGDRITFKVTQIGSTIAGSGLRFTVKGVLV